MHALLISGSPRVGSGTAALAALVGDALRDRGATVTSLELAEPSAPRLRCSPDRYDAVVLASPVHHASYSGLLKVALDDVPGDWLADTAVGLVAHGSGPRTGSVVCEHLRTVAKALGGWVAPTQIAACPADFTPGPPGTAPLPDSALLRRCDALAAELHRCAAMLRAPVAGHV
ncbi:NAD(P)H-dependent oxidoreductase [Streptomyces bambusae]|uniref:NADPH-dependent FMN reductase n=1 Tax=Streptomyces bambusae TaxID=1550616 RepID=UPI001CFCF832|nr:NADPH-dependent FMN reductase [Streptomyces bambusae]MCB5164665.1 NAD(P)H-dependent oxidoreductase [Streptomyces bambusae]